MQTVACPSCGAPLEFKSHAAVMAVCEYCRATVLKDADSVRDIGKMSSVLEDYSPIQIGTSGSFAQRQFTVIGRIQLRYADGMWNEWYILFDDGETGWLGDFSGQYSITLPRELTELPPLFESVERGRRYLLGGQSMLAADKRSATCVGGQGELPFAVGQGWSARVADFRKGASFLTLDYSDGHEPLAFQGHAVELADLKCQLLRDDDAVLASAGRYRGKLSTLECTACGTAIQYLPGLTTTLVCPSCATQLDASGPKAEVLASAERIERRLPTLALGAKARVVGQDYTVIGAMERTDGSYTWTEYLVYTGRAGFFWLVETDEGWFRAQVESRWPEWSIDHPDTLTLDGASFERDEEYVARVTWAAGAFNWRVKAGDEVRVIEYTRGQQSIAAELAPEELTFSRSQPIAFDQLRAWFGKSLGAAPLTSNVTEARDDGERRPGRFLMWLFGLNVIPLALNFSGTFIILLIATALLYMPVIFPSTLGEDD